MTMPADPSVDLATLDALFAAATPGAVSRYGKFNAQDSFGSPLAAFKRSEDADFYVALVNAWPALRRRLEIGDAAVATLNAYEAMHGPVAGYDPLYRAPADWDEEAALRMRMQAARARLRALREAQNG